LCHRALRSRHDINLLGLDHRLNQDELGRHILSPQEIIFVRDGAKRHSNYHSGLLKTRGNRERRLLGKDQRYKRSVGGTG
jgi:hypothetical protein